MFFSQIFSPSVNNYGTPSNIEKIKQAVIRQKSYFWKSDSRLAEFWFDMKHPATRIRATQLSARKASLFFFQLCHDINNGAQSSYCE